MVELVPVKNRGNAGKGRAKGAVNKSTAVAKNVIAETAERLGGIERLVAWVRESDKNEQIFWTIIYPKLLPLQVNAEVDARIGISCIERQIVRPQN